MYVLINIQEETAESTGFHPILYVSFYYYYLIKIYRMTPLKGKMKN